MECCISSCDIKHGIIKYELGVHGGTPVMTILPLNPQIGSVSPQDEGQKIRTDKPSPVAQTEMADTQAAKSSDFLELSQNAQQIRTKQAEITHTQILENTADQVKKQAQEAIDLKAKLDDARQSGNASRTVALKQQIEQHLKNIEALQNTKGLDGEKILAEKSGTPNSRANDSVDRFAKDMSERVQNSRTGSDRQVLEDMDRAAYDARKERVRLQDEVRASVENAVRESSASRPRDVQDAEKYLANARNDSANSSARSKTTDEMASRAVKLLE
jgi:hypothetical protein